jgi:2-dehydro-3-deoxygalactonokinase
MPEASFVAGDWGTSHLRLFLCDAQGEPLDKATGPGAADVAGQFAGTFDSLIEPWQHDRPALPAILCGMVGSSIGWTQTGYVACPAQPAQIATACVALRDGRIHIVPGLSCRNRLQAPDVLRGEETQILGALHLQPDLRTGQHLLCLPGTHTKWVALDDGSVTEFLTAPTGELFAVIRDHSVLVADAAGAGRLDGGPAFEQGLAESARFPHAQLVHRIFECRSRRLSGDLQPDAAASYLSGLLIASDVRGALELFPESAAETIHLIGAHTLTGLYAQALASSGRETRAIDGNAAALAGLALLHRLLSREVPAHVQ